MFTQKSHTPRAGASRREPKPAATLQHPRRRLLSHGHPKPWTCPRGRHGTDVGLFPSRSLRPRAGTLLPGARVAGFCLRWRGVGWAELPYKNLADPEPSPAAAPCRESTGEQMTSSHDPVTGTLRPVSYTGVFRGARRAPRPAPCRPPPRLGTQFTARARHFLAAGLGGNHLTSLCLSFLVCKGD